MRVIHVLLIEDSAPDADLIALALEESEFDARLTRVETEEELVRSLLPDIEGNARAWDIVLSDYALPKFSALRALTSVQEFAPTVPVVIVSGTIGDAAAAEIMRRGAADFVSKSRLGSLGATIERAMAEKRAARERLQAQEWVREKEAQLLQETQAAFSEAQRTNRMKDEFLATLSHEMRTPLGVVTGYAQILESLPPGSPDFRMATEAIKRNTSTLGRLIDELLDMSRIVTGKFTLEMYPTDLVALVQGSVEEFAHSAAGKGVELFCSSEPVSAIVEIDPERVRQVVWNLVSNAIKFTAAGGSISVSLAVEGRDVLVRVEDSGEGLAPDFLPHAFERFRQEDGTTTRRHGGLGLGLSIAHQIVEMHGGRLEAASEGKGLGSCFTLRLGPVVLLR